MGEKKPSETVSQIRAFCERPQVTIRCGGPEVEAIEVR